MSLWARLRATFERVRALGALRVCLAAALVSLVLGFAAAALLPPARLHRIGVLDIGNSFDIPIFRCGAQIVGNADPYTIEPLASCERQLPAVFGGIEAPAPQPPYLLALFKPFSQIPEPRFAVAWAAVNVALAIIAAGFLSRLTRFHPLAVFLALTWGPGYDVLNLGQLAMALVLGVSWSAYELRRGRPRTAACALCLAMAEPHVGLPAFAALFALVPRARLPTAALFAAGIAASLALSGPQICWEYVSRILPLQALAEAANPQQYSLTLAAVALGVPALPAVRLGELQYALVAALSIVWANQLRNRLDDPAFVVALPSALAVVGGPYIHYSEMVALWPAVLLLASYATGGQRIAAAVLVGILTVPWRTGAWLKLDIVAGLSVVFVVWMVLAGLGRSRRLATCAAVALPIVLSHALIATTGSFHEREPNTHILYVLPAQPPLAVEAPWGANYATMVWGSYLRVNEAAITWREAGAKLGTLAAFALFFVLLVRFVYARGAAPRAAPS